MAPTAAPPPLARPAHSVRVLTSHIHLCASAYVQSAIAAGSPVCRGGECTATGACSNTYNPSDPRCTGPTAICQYHKCDPTKGCVEGLPAASDVRCQSKPPSPSTPVQDQDCNAWYCKAGACVWDIKPSAVCDVRAPTCAAWLLLR